jgi:hypothetical protein
LINVDYGWSVLDGGVKDDYFEIVIGGLVLYIRIGVNELASGTSGEY